MKFSTVKRNIFFTIAFVLFSVNVPAGISFSEGDINQDNRILFTVRNDIPGSSVYSTLLEATVRGGEAKTRPEILTCYPEQIEIVQDGKILQFRNRYGTAWYDIGKKTFAWKNPMQKMPENSMRLTSHNVSSDGMWSCYVEKKDYASGFLVLENIRDGKKAILDDKADFRYKKNPSKWGDDSSVLLYEKDGNVFFCNPDAVLKGIEADEEFRKIGKGTIDSVCWAGGKYFVYIDGDIIYRINTKELYTVGLYSPIIGKGMSLGRLPHKFSPTKDRFSVSPFISSLAIIHDEKDFSWYRLKSFQNCDRLEAVESRAFGAKDASLLESKIIWSGSQEPCLWVLKMPFDKEIPYATLYKPDENFSKIMDIEDSGFPCVSPSGSMCAFSSAGTLYIYSTLTWKQISSISGEKTESLAWDRRNNLYAGGDKTTKRWEFGTGTWKTLMLSQVSNALWNGADGIVSESPDGKNYAFDNESRTWIQREAVSRRANIIRNENYRIFTGKTNNPNYENALYVRNLKGKATTKSVIEESTLPSSPKKKVALSIEAYDNADGVAKILRELKNYGIRGTFFLNGEFIRRYPNETRQISLSKNECASMFFTTAKLVNKDYMIDEDFIRRGLARNEDEFFRCTGRELSLYWHAPYYAKTEKAVQVGKEAGYLYAEANCKSLDIVTLSDSAAKGTEYKTTAKIIDNYMASVKKNSESIISVSAGISYGERESYLYENLDLLLSAILDEGAEIVQVRDIVK